MDTLDTSVDIRALDDAGDFDDIDVTEQLSAIDAEEIDVTALTLITGGMRWEQFRQSKNAGERGSRP